MESHSLQWWTDILRYVFPIFCSEKCVKILPISNKTHGKGLLYNYKVENTTSKEKVWDCEKKNPKKFLRFFPNCWFWWILSYLWQSKSSWQQLQLHVKIIRIHGGWKSFLICFHQRNSPQELPISTVVHGKFTLRKIFWSLTNNMLIEEFNSIYLYQTSLIIARKVNMVKLMCEKCCGANQSCLTNK